MSPSPSSPERGKVPSQRDPSLPLHGRCIAVTGSPTSGSRLAARLRELGADILDLPLIQIRHAVEKERAFEVFNELAHYEWIIFSSCNGVEHFFKVFLQTYEDIRSLGFMRIAAIGEGTAEAIRAFHLKVDIQPETATAEALGEALRAEQSLDNLRVLLITGNRNREDLQRLLENERAIVDTFPVYATEPTDLADHPGARQFREQGADALIFASASAVQSFGEQAAHLKLGKGATVPALCSFGPQTSARMRQAKIPIAVEATSPGIEPLVEGLLEKFRR